MDDRVIGPLGACGDIGAARYEVPEEVGTCWKALVTSWIDIFEGIAELVGGGVSPPSDLTSWIVNGRAVRSSAIPSSEFTAGIGSLSAACDHTAFKCSGSGALAGESLGVKFSGDFVHDGPNDADAGFSSERSVEPSEFLLSICALVAVFGDSISFAGSRVTTSLELAGNNDRELEGTEGVIAMLGSPEGRWYPSSSSLPTMKLTEPLGC